MKSPVSEWRKYPERYRATESGEVYSFSKVLVASNSFSKQVPYFVALIKLDSGKMTTSHVVDVLEGDIKIGVRVKPVFRKISHEGDNEALAYGTKFIIDNQC